MINWATALSSTRRIWISASRFFLDVAALNCRLQCIASLGAARCNSGCEHQTANAGFHLPDYVISHLQRMSAVSRFCGKTNVCERRNGCSKCGASAFPVRLCALAAVQERSWPVCEGFGRLRRGGIRRLRRMDLVIGGDPGRGCV